MSGSDPLVGRIPLGKSSLGSLKGCRLNFSQKHEVSMVWREVCAQATFALPLQLQRLDYTPF